MAKARILPIVLNDNERKHFLKQANIRYVTGHRNRVMLQLMFNLGLRLAEVVNLHWADMDFMSEVLMVRKGKGRKDRTLYIKDNNWRGEDDKASLLAWKQRQAAESGFLPEYVFTTMSKNSSGEQISDRYVQNMVERYRRRAGIEKKISPHSCRHCFGTDLYKHTKDIVVVKNSLGHSDISTAMIYVTLVGSDVEKALSGLTRHHPQKVVDTTGKQ